MFNKLSLKTLTPNLTNLNERLSKLKRGKGGKGEGRKRKVWE